MYDPLTTLLAPQQIKPPLPLESLGYMVDADQTEHADPAVVTAATTNFSATFKALNDRDPPAKEKSGGGGGAASNAKTTQPVGNSRLWLGLRDPHIMRVSRTVLGKDRHSKVYTVRGLRDRRIVLSVQTAIELYDLQDKLGVGQPSKVVDWLLTAAQHEIDMLPPLHLPPNFPSSALAPMAFVAPAVVPGLDHHEHGTGAEGGDKQCNQLDWSCGQGDPAMGGGYFPQLLTCPPSAGGLMQHPLMFQGCVNYPLSPTFQVVDSTGGNAGVLNASDPF